MNSIKHQVDRLDIRPKVTVVLRAANALFDRGHHPGPGAGSAALTVGARHEDLAQTTIPGLQRTHLGQHGHQAVPGVVGVRHRLGHLGQRVDMILEQRLDQLLLRREAAVDGADAQARMPGDVVQRHIESTVGEHFGRGGQDALPVAFGVPAKRAFAGIVGGAGAGRRSGKRSRSHRKCSAKVEEISLLAIRSPG